MYRQIQQPKRMREQKGRVFAPFLLLFCTLLHVPPEAFTPISRWVDALSFLRYAYPVGGGRLS